MPCSCFYCKIHSKWEKGDWQCSGINASIFDSIGLIYEECKCIANAFAIGIHWKAARKGLSLVRH